MNEIDMFLHSMALRTTT